MHKGGLKNLFFLPGGTEMAIRTVIGTEMAAGQYAPRELKRHTNKVSGDSGGGVIVNSAAEAYSLKTVPALKGLTHSCKI